MEWFVNTAWKKNMSALERKSKKVINQKLPDMVVFAFRYSTSSSNTCLYGNQNVHKKYVILILLYGKYWTYKIKLLKVSCCDRGNHHVEYFFFHLKVHCEAKFKKTRRSKWVAL